jgi:hypothetical protein
VLDMADVGKSGPCATIAIVTHRRGVVYAVTMVCLVVCILLRKAVEDNVCGTGCCSTCAALGDMWVFRLWITRVVE